MHVRGTRLTVPVDRVDEVIRHFSEQTAPEAAKVAGNTGAILLVDRTSGACLGLTYWEDEAALRASEDAGRRLRGAAIERFGAREENVDGLEIVLLERAAPAQAGAFVRVNDMHGDPARLDEAARFMAESVVPAVRAQKGFRALILAANRQSGRMIISTAWDTLDDLRASEAGVADLRRQALEKAGAGEVKIDVFEAVFAEMRVPAARA